MNEARKERKAREEVVEELLKSRFGGGKPLHQRVPSNAQNPERPARMDRLTLPPEKRGPMPFTKEKFVVKENQEEVEWEREVRKFLVNLPPAHGHRVSASMIWEWATGLKVKDLMEKGGSTVDLKRINRILRYYFGKPYMTYIMGRKVPNAYKVRPGYYITRHRPMTLTLYAEYAEGTRGHRGNP